MKYCVKEQEHKGNYKAHSNEVKASFSDRIRQIIFQLTNASVTCAAAMKELLN